MKFDIKQHIWKVLTGIIIVFSVVGAIWGMEKQFMTREYGQSCIEDVNKSHKLWLAEVTTAVKEIQKDSRIQRVYDEVYFWQKTVMDLSQACSAHPNDINLKKKLDGAQDNLNKAEDRLKELQK